MLQQSDHYPLSEDHFSAEFTPADLSNLPSDHASLRRASEQQNILSSPPLLHALGHIVTIQFMLCIVLATGLVLSHTFAPNIYRDLSDQLARLITQDDGFSRDTAILIDRFEQTTSQADPPVPPPTEQDPEEIEIPPAEQEGMVDLATETQNSSTLWDHLDTQESLWSSTPKELLQQAEQEAVIPANAVVTKVRYDTELSFPLDLPMVVTSGYGVRQDPISGDLSFHTGVDLRAPEGATIKAPLAGEVLAAGEGKTLGNYVKLRHKDGSISLYGHCSKLHVKTGDQVKQGAVLAEVGNTGRSTGPHLHLSFLLDGKYVNPGYIFEDVPV